MTTDLSSLNEQQRAAVRSESPRLLVLAGAGSGKTKTLLQKIIYLIEEKQANASNILAITFTKNAANEMLDRLILTADDTEVCVLSLLRGGADRSVIYTPPTLNPITRMSSIWAVFPIHCCRV